LVAYSRRADASGATKGWSALSSPQGDQPAIKQRFSYANNYNPWRANGCL
jgi:hypothetical protein